MLTSSIFVPTGFFPIHWTKWKLISKISLYLKLEYTFWIVLLDKKHIVFTFICEAFTIEALANKMKETYDGRTMITFSTMLWDLHASEQYIIQVNPGAHKLFIIEPTK